MARPPAERGKTLRTHWDHTPGPWTRDGGVILDSRRNVVACRYSWRHADHVNLGDAATAISPVEADANCRLMAAAPELLDALKGLRPLFETGDADNYVAEIITAEAAIAKAEGRDEA